MSETEQKSIELIMVPWMDDAIEPDCLHVRFFSFMKAVITGTWKRIMAGSGLVPDPFCTPNGH